MCDRHCRFAIASALMSPRLAIARLDVTPKGQDIYRVVVQLENQGFLPTYTSQKALERSCVKPIEVSLSLPEEASLISGQLKQEVGHLEGRGNRAFKTFALGVDYRCHVEWTIQARSGSEIEIVARSQRAGTVRTSVIL
ncbi:MAG: hypothetical protein AB4038_13850 [Prochloraceae cyanobacterium]